MRHHVVLGELSPEKLSERLADVGRVVGAYVPRIGVGQHAIDLERADRTSADSG